jgi:HSP20 family protein
MAEHGKEVVRWDPFRDLDVWGPSSTRLARLLDDAFGEHRLAAVGLKSPPLDVTESDDEYVISAEIPGVKREDLTVECKDGVLSIRGEKKSEREETKDKARILERSYGAFSRALSLPQDADFEKVHATFKDGVLRVTIQKTPETKPKAIAIKS